LIEPGDSTHPRFFKGGIMTELQIQEEIGLAPSTFYDFRRRSILPTLPSGFEFMDKEELSGYIEECKYILTQRGEELKKKGKKNRYSKFDCSLPKNLQRFEDKYGILGMKFET
jgi:hypothetical protein